MRAVGLVITESNILLSEAMDHPYFLEREPSNGMNWGVKSKRLTYSPGSKTGWRLTECQ